MATITREPIIVQSPPQATAKEELLIIEDVSSTIKALISEHIQLGVSKEDTTRAIESVIVEKTRRLRLNPASFARVRLALAQFARSAYYVHRRNMTTLNASIFAILDKQGYIEKDKKTINFMGKSYSLNIADLLQDGEIRPSDLLTKQEFRGLRTEIYATTPQIRDYEKLVRARYAELATDTPKASYIKQDGKPVNYSLRNLAEMQVRYEANQEDLKKLDEDGVDLVWTSSHANCSERCERWQGRLYSRSGKSGTINVIRYTPLQEALDGINNDGNGIINGYGCRHYLIEYIDGSKAPTDFNSKTIDKERLIDKKQRYYEQSIRATKQLEAVERASGNVDRANVLKGRWKEKLKTYQQFSLTNGRAFYKWRTQVFRSPNKYVEEDVDE